MKWQKEKLDVILVPGGLLVMFGYHIFLLYRYLRNPKATVIGFENHCQKAWVNKLMKVDVMSRGPAFTVMNSTITATNFMASTSLTLSSLIGAWVGSSSSNEVVTRIIYGDTGIPITSVKYISILLFFLLAFASFVQSSRCYVQANLLLSMPKAAVPEELVVEALVHGANFWQVGLRAIYFAITMLMWIFGPIPMFLSSVAMVVVLHVLDVNNKLLHDFDESSRLHGEGKQAACASFQQQQQHQQQQQQRQQQQQQQQQQHEQQQGLPGFGNNQLQASALSTAILSTAAAVSL